MNKAEYSCATNLQWEKRKKKKHFPFRPELIMLNIYHFLSLLVHALRNRTFETVQSNQSTEVYEPTPLGHSEIQTLSFQSLFSGGS